ELKTPAGPARDAQALRRARAYVQLVRAHQRPLQGSWLDRAQWAFYRRVPLAVPWLLLALLQVPWAVAARRAGWAAAGAVAALELLALCVPPGSRLVRLAWTIWRATRLEAREALSDRWEMARP